MIDRSALSQGTDGRARCFAATNPLLPLRRRGYGLWSPQRANKYRRETKYAVGPAYWHYTEGKTRRLVLRPKETAPRRMLQQSKFRNRHRRESNGAVGRPCAARRGVRTSDIHSFSKN